MVIRKEAENEIAEGFRWYDQQRKGLGAEFLAEISATLAAVGSQPLRFPLIFRYLRRAQVRRFPYGVIFTTDSDVVVIIAAMHFARNPEGWMSRH